MIECLIPGGCERTIKDCETCGHNAEEAARRKKLPLVLCDDGLKRKFVAVQKKGEFVYRLPERLNQARKNAGMSLSELAKIIGVTSSTIQFHESGRTPPNAITLIAYADALGVSVEWLLGG